MTHRIIYTDATGTMGLMLWEDQEVSGPLPPNAGDLRPIYDRMIEEGVVPEPWAAPASSVPDGPTNSDWRVALILMERFDDVEAAVVAARDGGSPEGKIAWQRFEYANNVYRSELLALAPFMGFTSADVEQSLAIAAQVAAGATSG